MCSVRNNQSYRLLMRDDLRIKKSLARISDGSDRARAVHVLCVCFYGPALSPVITARANDQRRRAATIADGNSDGLDCNRNHLFTIRKTFGSALQSISNVDILSARE